MSSNPIRILIVDDRRELARVLRASLELLERGYIVVGVPSGEEAILESGPFDLVVAEYRLPGMTGLALIERIARKQPDLKSILITGQGTEDLSEEVARLGVFVVLEKPIDSEDFTRAVQEALHGAQTDEWPDLPPDSSEPVPDIEDGPVALVLSAMRSDLGANAIALVNRQGHLIQHYGTLPENLRFSELAVLLAANFTTTGEISAYLGEKRPAAVHFYDGGSYDVYSLALGPHYFAAIVFPAGSEGKMRDVVRFATRAATELIPMIGGEESEGIGGGAEAVQAEEVSIEETGGPPPETPPFEDGKFDAGVVEIDAPESIDLDALEDALAQSDSGDAESFWDSVLEVEASSENNGDAISLDEAVDLGLVPKELDS